MSQMEIISLDSLLPSTHPYRGSTLPCAGCHRGLADVIHMKGADGYGAERLFRCLLLQFMEDPSDREAQHLEENLAVKWFYGFTLSEPVPDYSLFNRVRTRIGPTRLFQHFPTMRAQVGW